MGQPVLPAPDAARALLDAMRRRQAVPGIQYLVVDADRVLFEYAGGWADIAGGRPLTGSTTLMAYSMSKTITAAAVLQLVEAGTVALDDPIDRWLEAQPYGPGITLRQVLSHTAGMPSPIPLRWVHPAALHATFDERAALARVLHDHPRPASPPGARYRYSNIGYWLLGSIVERASGEPFPSYVRAHILAPLGITPAELDDVIPDARHHAKGYLEKYSLLNLMKRLVVDRDLVGGYEGTWLHLRDHYVNGAAFGGLVGSGTGFAKFLQDQLRPRSRLFGDAMRQQFVAPQATRNGSLIPMTLGWHVGSLDGVQVLYKEGGGGGFHCMMRLYPSRGIGTVAMTNATGFNVRQLLDKLDLPLLC
jgi:D-alanyl-D-alanine carboxypeptidase